MYDQPADLLQPRLFHTLRGQLVAMRPVAPADIILLADLLCRLSEGALRLRYIDLEGPNGEELYKSLNLREADLRHVPPGLHTIELFGRNCRVGTFREGPITLHVGRTYRIWAYNGDDPDVPESHSLSSITAIGLFGGDLPNGGSLPVQDITPLNPGDYPFNCTTFCGSQVGHDGMVGIIHVVP